MSNSRSGIWITAVSESWPASVTNHSLVSVPLGMKWHPKGSITPATWGGRAPICDWRPKSDWRRPMLTLVSPAECLPASRNPRDYRFLQEIYAVRVHFSGTMFAGFLFTLLALWLLVSHSCNSHGFWFERRGRRRPSADVFMPWGQLWQCEFLWRKRDAGGCARASALEKWLATQAASCLNFVCMTRIIIESKL